MSSFEYHSYYILLLDNIVNSIENLKIPLPVFLHYINVKF